MKQPFVRAERRWRGEEEGRGGIERLAVLSPDAIEVQSGVVRVGEGGQDANPG